MTPKAGEKNDKKDVHKLNFINSKNFYTSDAINERVKRQPTEWEQTIYNQIPYGDLYLDYIKYSLQLSKISNLIKK